jgi:hypothetical protein
MAGMRCFPFLEPRQRLGAFVLVSNRSFCLAFSIWYMKISSQDGFQRCSCDELLPSSL